MRICATPPSDSEAIIVPQGHAVKRRVVLAADLESVRGAIHRDVCACVVAWFRAASAASAARSRISETEEVCDPVLDRKIGFDHFERETTLDDQFPKDWRQFRVLQGTENRVVM